ncbi:MAG: hypothetical protein KZQ93_19000 [Candidatus Thiodiazotropha sp. (ex Monitilora ramsayi)]|nr:hypothetical protein [Candidatus Thiodiazotropha sp. (ex Monitilora ramsayi)]
MSEYVDFTARPKPEIVNAGIYPAPGVAGGIDKILQKYLPSLREHAVLFDFPEEACSGPMKIYG